MNGGATYRVTANKDEADRIAACAMAVVPLYDHPQPTLTDAERSAILWAEKAAADWTNERASTPGGLCHIALRDRNARTFSATLRSLLERHKGGEQ